MEALTCQIEFAEDPHATIRCGKPAVAECADCGTSICSACRSECCGDSFCDYCYDYHVAHPVIAAISTLARCLPFGFFGSGRISRRECLIAVGTCSASRVPSK